MQITGADLEQLPTHAQPGEGKLGIRARGEHQVQGSRQMIEQEEHALLDGLVRDHMVVIQDEDELSIHLLHLIEERGQDGRERRSLWRMKHLSRRLAKGGQISLHCGNDREPEADRIIVWLVKGEPGKSRFGSPRFCALLRLPAWEYLRRSCHPCGEQRGLPTSGSSRDERQRVRERCIQFTE